MAALTLLTIGLPLSLAAKRAWERRGLFLTLAQSPREAVQLLRFGDFDVCLLGRSISNESRARFVSIIREAMHLAVPVISIDDQVDGIDKSQFRPLTPRGTAMLAHFMTEAKRAPAIPTAHFHYRFKRVL
jgi:hypothetical protein